MQVNITIPPVFLNPAYAGFIWLFMAYALGILAIRNWPEDWIDRTYPQDRCAQGLLVLIAPVSLVIYIGIQLGRTADFVLVCLSYLIK